MKETHITIYIHDLEISDKSKSFLARVGLMKLDDLLNCNMTELSAMRNISEDVLQELNGVIAHSDVIISFFEERAKPVSYTHLDVYKRQHHGQFFHGLLCFGMFHEYPPSTM